MGCWIFSGKSGVQSPRPHKLFGKSAYFGFDKVGKKSTKWVNARQLFVKIR
jgi:hypothetical protein